MGYELLGKIIELSGYNKSLEERFKKVARHVANELGFDSCTIYKLNREDNTFTRLANSGARKSIVNMYGKKEGLCSWVRKNRKTLQIYNPDTQNILWNGIEDRAMKGFKTVVVSPIKDESHIYGAIYLRAKNKTTLTERKKNILHVVAKLLCFFIKCDIDYKRLKRTYTKLKEMQTRLSNAEKLMALGELSATLAHEIKNPLVSIGGLAARLQKKLPESSPEYIYVEHIVKEVTKLEEIINDILHFTEDRTLKFTPVELNNIVEEAILGFEEICRRNSIKVEKLFSTDPIPVMADTGQLKIAFDNIIINAIQSMEGGGTLTITTYRKKKWAHVEIKDTGGGIEPHLIGNIFNPFFTTRKGGTGLGLPITHKIVTRHKGHIDVANEYGKGITFTIRLPLTDGRTGGEMK